MHAEGIHRPMRATLVLLLGLACLATVVPLAEAQPGGVCGWWPPSGHSYYDVDCIVPGGDHCDVWSYDGWCWQIW